VQQGVVWGEVVAVINAGKVVEVALLNKIPPVSVILVSFLGRGFCALTGSTLHRSVP
jgi:hypothetical protein